MISSTRPLTLGPAAPTRRACEIAASLGFALDDPLPIPRATLDLASLPIPPRSLTLLLGPSGSGKSMLLRALAHSHSARGLRIVHPPATLPDRPAVDLFPSLTLDDALAALSRAGLAEAGCFVRRPSELSDGQRDRLRLALALHHATHTRDDTNSTTLLLLDEFAALLDEDSARSLAFLLRRFISRSHPPISAVIATPRSDLARWLRPDRAITLSPSHDPIISTHLHASSDPPHNPLADISISPGSRADYLALAPLHYRASHPATFARILIATSHRCADHPTIAGVLVVSMPVLNARWRNLAWPGRYTSPDKRRLAHLLNDELRCISRVIIDPRFRALGLAQHLVRAYLADPITPSVEAVAAMGRASPFFERAGMTPYHLTPSPRSARLLDALDHLGLEPWQLATPTTTLSRAQHNQLARDLLHRELLRWASSSRASPSTGSIPTLFRAACRSIACPQTAYAWTFAP